jgi:hypothetical protein
MRPRRRVWARRDRPAVRPEDQALHQRRRLGAGRGGAPALGQKRVHRFPRLDGTTLVVRIPMRFQCRGGRKRIVAPDGSELTTSSKPQPDGTLVKALARAWRWQRMLDDGVHSSVSEIGDAENISKSYVSRILRLALLEPDIIEAILAGRADQSLMLERLEQPLPAKWTEQHQLLLGHVFS